MPEEIIEINARMDDDFNDGLLSGNKWVYNSGIGTVSESNGVLSTGKTSLQSGIMTQVRSASALIGDFDLSVKIRRRDVNSSAGTIGFFLGSYDDVTPNNATGFLIGFYGSQWKVTSKAPADTYTDQFVGSSHLQDVWYTIRVTRSGTVWNFYLNDSLLATTPLGHSFPIYFTSYRYWKEVSGTIHYGTLEFDDLSTNNYLTNAHIGQTLPFKTCLPVDKNTQFLAHYDITEEESLYGVKPMGNKYSLDLDGTTNIVELGNVNNMGLGDFSIDFWIQTTTTTTQGYIISKSKAAAVDNRYAVGINAGKIMVFMCPLIVNGDIILNGAIPVNDGKWHHVTISFDRDANVSIYIDGTLDKFISISSWSTVNMVSTFPFRIGSYTTEAMQPMAFFDGKISEVRVWSKALNSIDILEDMNTHLEGTENNLISYWKANDGEGSLLYDYSLNKNHGDIVGIPNWDYGRVIFTLRHSEGKYGGAIAIEEGTTNLIPLGQRTCSIPFNQQSKGGGLGVITFTNEANIYGRDDVNKVIITPNSPADNPYAVIGITDALLAVPGDILTFSFEYKILQGSESPEFESVYANGYKVPDSSSAADLDLATITDIGNGWKRYSRKMVITVAGNSWFRINQFSQGKLTEVILDNFQIEKKEFSTSFVDGSRPDSNLKYQLSPITGDFTVSFWHMNNKPTATAQHIFSLRDKAAANHFDYFAYPSSSTLRITNRKDGILTANKSYTGRNVLNKWSFVSFVNNVQDNTFKLYYDGILVDTVESINGKLEEVHVGVRNDSLGIYSLNGLIDELRIDNIARTEDEIKQWWYSQSPFFPKGIHRIYS